MAAEIRNTEMMGKEPVDVVAWLKMRRDRAAALRGEIGTPEYGPLNDDAEMFYRAYAEIERSRNRIEAFTNIMRKNGQYDVCHKTGEICRVEEEGR